jgi:hypothetical protein
MSFFRSGFRGKWFLVLAIVVASLLGSMVGTIRAQSLSSGTVTGVVKDPSGAAVSGAMVEIRNAITQHQETASTDTNGAFRFTNVPFNPYRLNVNLAGFQTFSQDLEVRSAIPVSLEVGLKLAGTATSVTVEATGADVLETEPSAHSDVGIVDLAQLPITTPGAGLSEAITMTAPGVVADSNGFFHPLGDHAETSFQIDGQPVNDQLGKVFSTQLPTNALESMELVTGFPNAEYGEKTSLIVNATTRSGLGLKPRGDFLTSYGSFGTVAESANIGFGTKRIGEFLALNGSRSGRFLDTPEFAANHDIGNNGSVFNRLDFQPDTNNAFHLNMFFARNWFQIPNTFEQPDQDQRQRVISFNIAPGYQHIFNEHTLLTINPFIRHDQVNYYPSSNVFNDTPLTASQQRQLLNLGVKTDLSYARGAHNLKIGFQFMRTRLVEHFGLGVTDPTFNPVCFSDSDLTTPVTNRPTLTNPANCAGANFFPNTEDNGFLPGLVPFDLTRGGSLLSFSATGPIKEYSAYVQDTINWRGFTLNPGLRVTRYDGLSQATGVQPRIGVAYLVKRTGTVLRFSYARTLETPHNENLLLSSSTGVGGLTNAFSAVGQQPLPSGRRNQYNVGFQQAVGKFLIIDGDYWWKFTHNAAEFDVLLTTPITFPIMWRQDKLDGFGIRVSSLDIQGFRVNTTIGAGRLRYFGPEVGGLIFNAPLANVFRTDSDDPFYQTTQLRYQHRKRGPWVAFTWRYDRGMVAGGVTADLAGVLGLSADQQTAIGFFCGSDVATLTHQITSCDLPFGQYGATRVRIPAPGTADDDKNPPRIAPRHLLDVGIGDDDLFRFGGDRYRFGLHFTAVNLTNKVAMYNFLSTFGGTHFVTPRSYTAEVGFHF